MAYDILSNFIIIKREIKNYTDIIKNKLITFCKIKFIIKLANLQIPYIY
jgi:hypothetical protein